MVLISDKVNGTPLSSAAQTVTPKGWFILKQNILYIFYSCDLGDVGSLLIQEDEKKNKNKKRQLTLGSDATRRQNVRTFSCVNSLFKYLHRFIWDSSFSLCFIWNRGAVSNCLGFLKRWSSLPLLPNSNTFTLQVYREKLGQQTCVADVALSGWEVSGRGCTTW